MKNEEMNIAIIRSIYNTDITEKLLAGAAETLLQAGVPKNQVDILHVPGAVEIPLTAKLLAMKNKYHAIICLGAVIRGETDHYDYVCQQVSQGCQQVMMDFMIPVIFGILTTNDEEQAQARVCSVRGHKGVEAATAAIDMIKLVHQHNRWGL